MKRIAPVAAVALALGLTLTGCSSMGMSLGSSAVDLGSDAKAAQTGKEQLHEAASVMYADKMSRAAQAMEAVLAEGGTYPATVPGDEFSDIRVVLSPDRTAYLMAMREPKLDSYGYRSSDDTYMISTGPEPAKSVDELAAGDGNIPDGITGVPTF